MLTVSREVAVWAGMDWSGAPVQGPLIIGLPPEKWSFLKWAFGPEEDEGMPQKKHKPEEIVAKLRQVDVLVSQGQSVAEAVRSIGVTPFTYYRWRKEFGGLKADQVKRLKELEKENERLRKAVSDLTLEKLILREAASGNY
jgi:putative transposase